MSTPSSPSPSQRIRSKQTARLNGLAHRPKPVDATSTITTATQEDLTIGFCDYLISQCRLILQENYCSEACGRALDALASDAQALKLQEHLLGASDAADRVTTLTRRWEALRSQLGLDVRSEEMNSLGGETNWRTTRARAIYGDDDIDVDVAPDRGEMAEITQGLDARAERTHAPEDSRRKDTELEKRKLKEMLGVLKKATAKENKPLSLAAKEQENMLSPKSVRVVDAGGRAREPMRYRGPEAGWVPERRQPLRERSDHFGTPQAKSKHEVPHQLVRVDSQQQPSTPRAVLAEISNNVPAAPKKRKSSTQEDPTDAAKESGRPTKVPRKAKSHEWTAKDECREERRPEKAEEFVIRTEKPVFKEIRW